MVERGKRSDGLILIPWQKGRPLFWDRGSSVDTLVPSYVALSSTKAGGSAAQAETAKSSRDFIFAVFAVESLGPWSPDAHKF